MAAPFMMLIVGELSGVCPILFRNAHSVKSTNHFMAAYVAKRVIYIESDGPLARDYRKMVYTKVKRPIWPLDAETQPGLIF